MSASVDRDVAPVPTGVRIRREPRWTNHMEPVEPVADRRLGGNHWWDPDRIAHMDDMPNFCPACAASIEDTDGSIAVEYWQGDDRVYHVRCHACDWSGEVTRVTRMVGHEPPHE